MSRRILIFNPENDLALAANDPHYTPPASALQMASDLQSLPLLWADPDDLILQRDSNSNLPTPISPHSTLHPKLSTLNSLLSTFNSQLLPWGWSPLLVRQLRECGVPSEMLPSQEQMSAYHAYASRHTSVILLKRLRESMADYFSGGKLVGESVWCESEKDVNEAVCNYSGHAMLKAPWSGSGRGIHPISAGISEQDSFWIRRTMQRQGGIEVEPYYQKEQDFALEFWAEEGKVRYEGLSLFTTSDGGVYSGNLVASEQEKERRMAHFIPISLLHDVRSNLQNLLESSALPQWYTGPLGIDMMILRLSGDASFAIHPFVEINFRMTMGWVALQIARRQTSDAVLRFRICFDGKRYSYALESA